MVLFFYFSANELQKNSDAFFLKKNIFQEYCLFCSRLTTFRFDHCGLLSQIVCHS